MKAKDYLVGLAMVTIIFCGALYLNDHTVCTDLGGLIKGACVLK